MNKGNSADELPLALQNLIIFMQYNNYTPKDINIDKLAVAFNATHTEIIEILMKNC